MGAPHDRIGPLQPAISPREAQLLELSAGGLTDAEIAIRLQISASTVTCYWTRLRSKLGAKSRTEAVAIALRSQAESEARRIQLQVEKAGARPGTPDDADALSEIVEQAPDGIFIASARGCFLYVNRQLARMFGYGPEDLVGEHLAKLVPARFRERHLAHVAEYVSQPTHKRMGHGLFVPALRADGTEFVVCITLSAVQRSDQAGQVIGMVRDYSEEWAALERLGMAPPPF